MPPNQDFGPGNPIAPIVDPARSIARLSDDLAPGDVPPPGRRGQHGRNSRVPGKFPGGQEFGSRPLTSGGSGPERCRSQQFADALDVKPKLGQQPKKSPRSCTIANTTSATSIVGLRTSASRDRRALRKANELDPHLFGAEPNRFEQLDPALPLALEQRKQHVSIWRSGCQVSSVECRPRCCRSGAGEAECSGGEAPGEVLDVGQSHMRGLATPGRWFRRWLTRV